MDGYLLAPLDPRAANIRRGLQREDESGAPGRNAGKRRTRHEMDRRLLWFFSDRSQGARCLVLAVRQLSRQEPVLGLILPTAAAVPAEALALYSTRMKFVMEGLSKPGDPPLTGTIATYERLQDRIVPAARALVEKGASAIVLLGTSVTFYKGAAHDKALIDSIQKATNRPATTMSTAIVDAVKTVGGRRLAVATGYTEEVNAQFEAVLSKG